MVFTPSTVHTPAWCFPTHCPGSVAHTNPSGGADVPAGVAVAVTWPRLAWEAPSQCKSPLTPRGAQQTLGMQCWGSPPLQHPRQNEVTLCSHQAVPLWDQGLCQNHPEIRDHWSRAGSKFQVQTKSWLEAAFPQVPDCPLLLLGATGTPQGAQPHCHMPPASSAEVL